MKKLTIPVSFISWSDLNGISDLFVRTRFDEGNHLKLTEWKIFTLKTK